MYNEIEKNKECNQEEIWQVTDTLAQTETRWHSD